MTHPPQNTAAVFGRYALMQLPSGFLVTMVLALLVHHEQLSAGIACALFGLWVAIQIALFPVLRIGYETGETHTGPEALVGAVGIAQNDLDPEGRVHLGAERWRAVVDGTDNFVPAGAEVRVREVRQLTLVVELVDPEAEGISDLRSR